MTDIHCHILPGVDDGAENMEEALAMARLAADSGVKTLVATPHCGIPGAARDNYASRELLERFQAFRAAVEGADIPLGIKAGAEILCTPETPRLFLEKKLLTLASSDYLLLEFFFDEPLSFMEDMLRQAAALGVTPVIAHPERYGAVQRQPAAAAGWFENGWVIQLNKGSVLGRFGRRPAETAAWLLERGLAHVVASDAHSAHSRTTDMSTLRRVLRENYSGEYADILLEKNPARIVENRPLVSA